MLVRPAFDIASEHECIIAEWKEDVDDAFTMVTCQCHMGSHQAMPLHVGDVYTCPVTGAHATLVS